MEKLNIDVNYGLSSSDIEELHEVYGYNELSAKKKKSLFLRFLMQFKDILIIILIIAAIISIILNPGDLLRVLLSL